MKNLFTIAAIALTMSACTGKSTRQSNPTEEAAIKQTVVKDVKDSLTLDSFKKAEALKKEQKEAAAVETKSRQSSSGENQASSASSATSRPAASTTAPEAAPKKEGWSDAAKGSVIGGAAGAVGGALIDKKKGRGAIVGGVVGAGTGYLIGRGKDRKSGRVQKKDQ